MKFAVSRRLGQHTALRSVSNGHGVTQRSFSVQILTELLDSCYAPETESEKGYLKCLESLK